MAFLLDVVEAADAIEQAVEGIDLDAYCNSRLIRSAVEREFTIIGEALNNLSRVEPDLFSQIQHAPKIISFRNKLTHEYLKVDNILVWGVIERYLPPLRQACIRLAEQRPHGGIVRIATSAEFRHQLAQPCASGLNDPPEEPSPSTKSRSASRPPSDARLAPCCPT